MRSPLLKPLPLAVAAFLIPVLAPCVAAPPAGGEGKPAMIQTTNDITSRLGPLSQEERPSILKRIPLNGGRSQLADSFDGSWYLHRGDLTIDSSFQNTLNLVVDGDLTVRGTLGDGDALLVVTGDVRAENVLSTQLMVIMGSLRCSGLIHADYNDYCFEVWGPELAARALILTDKDATLPEKRRVEYEYNSNSSDNPGRAENHLVEALLRWYDADAISYKRVTSRNGVEWIDEAGEKVKASEAKKLKFESVVPASFEDIASAIHEGQPVFKKALTASLEWQLDRNVAPEVIANHAAGKDVKTRVAAAAHPQLPAELVRQLASDPEAAVRMTVVHHPRLEAAQAAVLVNDKSHEVRRQLAASAHAEAHLEKLVTDASPEVRRACASHPKLADVLRRKLLADEVKAVRTRALRYLPVTAAWVKELHSAKDEALVAWAIDHQDEVAIASSGNPSIASSDWQKDLMDSRVAVREAALRSAKHAKLLPYLEKHRDRFVKDESANIRMALASATRDAGTLEALSKDSDRLVRRFALDNLAAPESLLIAEAMRLSKAPASSWNTSDPGYIEHFSDVQDLLKHPRLPAEALKVIGRAYPRLYRLEPHRNMPLEIILERAEGDTPSLAFEPDFLEWKRIAKDPKGDHGKVFAKMLTMDDNTLQSAARMNPATPLAQLIAHAQAEGIDDYSLEEVAQNPQLKALNGDGAKLRAWLVSLNKGSVDNKLASNPDLPLEALKEIAGRSPEQATITLWQVHGVVMEGMAP